MKILKAFISGYNKAIDLKKIVTVMYSVTLLFVLAAVFAFNKILESAFAGRMELYKLLPDFNFTIYNDFMNNYGDIIRPFSQMAGWFGVLYFFFSIFFAGGILKYLDGSTIKSKVQAFFAGSAKFFFRFLRLGIYTLLIQFIFFIPIALVFSFYINSISDSYAEPQLFLIILIWMFIHLVVFLIILMISDYAKIILVKEDSKKVWKALAGGMKFVFRRIHLTALLYFLLIIMTAVLTVVYFLIEDFIGMSSSFTILIMFILQQIFVWLRLFFKVWLIGSEYDYYSVCEIEKLKPVLTQEMIMNESL